MIRWMQKVQLRCGHMETCQVEAVDRPYVEQCKASARRRATQRDCRDCSIEAAHAKLREHNIILPRLVGSRKQIKWAEEIRANRLSWLLHQSAKSITSFMRRLGNLPRQELLPFLAAAATHADAWWWSDHRWDLESPAGLRNLITKENEQTAPASKQRRTGKRDAVAP